MAGTISQVNHFPCKALLSRTPQNTQFKILSFPSIKPFTSISRSTLARQGFLVRAENGESSVAVAVEEPVQNYLPTENDMLKKQLVGSFFGTSGGWNVNDETKVEILELVTELEAKNPTPVPNDAMSLLNGKWILAYTSVSGLLPLISKTSSQIPMLAKVEQLSQTIDSENFTAQNSALFSGPLATTTTITTNAKFEVRSPKQLLIKFEEGVIGTPQLTDAIVLPESVEFMGQKIDLSAFHGIINAVQNAATTVVKKISSQPPVKFPISNPNAMAWMLNTYLDEDLRIARDDAGGVFVLIKEGSPLLNAA